MKRILFAGLLICALLAPGCKRLRPQESGPRPWWQRILNAPNEHYFDERSKNIEENLQRGSRQLGV